jgi:regulatory protein
MTRPFRRDPKTAPTASAYLAGLRLLARRELSESQVRQRLARRGYPDTDIGTAIARLKEERALDDSRVAGAIARTETGIRRRGRIRVRRQIEQAGIAADTAREAVDHVFADLDDDALLASSLARRLKDDRPIADDREFQRLYRYLVGQGFESHRVLEALSARRRPR